MRYYVYALVDPTDGFRPFYIGKGLDNRLQSHFKPNASSNSEVIGCNTDSILAMASEGECDLKARKIKSLLDAGFDHTEIARVIGRRMDEATAFAVESFLIHSIYGIENLTNAVRGAHSERFRTFGVWRHLDGYDLQECESAPLFQEIENRLGKYYVYVLRDPETLKVFYVGKGTGRRLFAHFSANEHSSGNGRLARVAALMANGFGSADIGRVVARVESEHTAFAIEALLVKFVYGQRFLENIQPGHHADMFRAFGDWEKRIGFDLPWVVEPGALHSRQEKTDGMIGEGLATPLLAIAAAFPNLKFDSPKVLDSADLGIEADVFGPDGGTRIKVFIRRKRLQVELRPRRKTHREWMRLHFKRLEAYPLRRADEVFFPDLWKGPENMTDDLTIMTERVRLLLEIVAASARSILSPEAAALLPVPLLSLPK